MKAAIAQSTTYRACTQLVAAHIRHSVSVCLVAQLVPETQCATQCGASFFVAKSCRCMDENTLSYAWFT